MKRTYEVLQSPRKPSTWVVLRDGEVVYVASDELIAHHWAELDEAEGSL